MKMVERKKQLAVLFLALLLLITFSCDLISYSDPPIDAAKSLFAKKYIKVIDNSNPYQIIKFVKTNSFKQNILGIDATVFQYNAVVEITNDCYFFEVKAGPELMFGYYIQLTTNKPDLFDNRRLEYVRVNKGRIFNIRGQIPFAKTEKGWQFLD